jgi:hypothetical protein
MADHVLALRHSAKKRKAKAAPVTRSEQERQRGHGRAKLTGCVIISLSDEWSSSLRRDITQRIVGYSMRDAEQVKVLARV